MSVIPPGGLLPAVVAWTYMVVNTGRVVFYVPQIKYLLKRNASAQGISTATWAGFCMSHLTALLYAMVVQHDSLFGFVCSLNLAFSLAIYGLATYRQMGSRIRYRIIRRAFPVLSFMRIV